MLHSLTSLRFFAAMMVVLSHLPGKPFAEGYTGVTFFFILSGFILSHRHADTFLAGEGSPREFWIGRVARIYPLHLLTMILVMPVTAISAASAYSFIGQLLANATLTQAFVPNYSVFFSFNAPAWSLSVEALFYLLFPVLVIARTSRLLVVLTLGIAYHLVVPGRCTRSISSPTFSHLRAWEISSWESCCNVCFGSTRHYGLR